MYRIRRLLLLSTSWLVAVGAGPIDADDPRAVVNLRPDVSADRAAMEVELRFPAAWLSAPAAPTFTLATFGQSYSKTRDRVEALVVRDADGVLPLLAPTRERARGIWRASRPARGTVTVTYRVPAVDPTLPQGGPITYLQSVAGGMSGAFRSLLLKPNVDGAHDIAIRWHLRPGEAAVSSAGIGDVDEHIDLASLDRQMFVVGPLTHVPSVLSDRDLVVAALGKPRDEIARARQWFAQAYDAMRAAFGASNAGGYRIMVFSHDRQVFNSGTSGEGGFLFFLPTRQNLNDFETRPIVAHEMVHSVVRSIPSEGDGGEDWYDEGIADYAAVAIPYAAGLYTPQDYVAVVNHEAALYYLNPLRQTSNDDIPKVKWSVNRAWSLGYSRGAMYFANLDAGLRQHGLHVTVFDLVRMMNRLPMEKKIGPADWEDLLRRHAGDWAVSQWRSMLAGELIRPVDGAFGPCLRAEQIQAGHYELGFTSDGLQKGSRVGAVVPGSSAARAGLRQGDILREGFDETVAEEEYDRPSTLKLLRDGKPIDIVYVPRSGQEVAYRWVVAQGKEDRPCRDVPRR